MSEPGGSCEAPKLQDPEENIKPVVDSDDIPDLVWNLYGLKATGIKSLPSYDDLNFFFRAEENTFENPNLKRVNQDGYVLKILNSIQSATPVIIDAQNAFCEHVRERGIPTQVPVQNKAGKFYSLEKFTNKDGNNNSDPYLVRVVTYISGNIFFETPYIPGSFYNIGKLAGRLHNAVSEGFHHTFYDTFTTIWSLSEVTSLRNFYQAVIDKTDLEIITEVVDTYEHDVLPNFKHLTKGIIHGDINEQNSIMMEVPGQENIPRDQRVHEVTGILDFSDSTKSYFIFDVAISIAYISIECPEPGQLDAGGHILAGYTESRKLKEVEFDLLKTLVCARLCQSLVYGAHAYSLQPNNEYLLTTAKKGWPLLRKLWKQDTKALLANWKTIMETYKTGSKERYHWSVCNNGV